MFCILLRLNSCPLLFQFALRPHSFLKHTATQQFIFLLANESPWGRNCFLGLTEPLGFSWHGDTWAWPLTVALSVCSPLGSRRPSPPAWWLLVRKGRQRLNCNTVITFHHMVASVAGLQAWMNCRSHSLCVCVSSRCGPVPPPASPGVRHKDS